ncbi:MAG: hypothetical protein KAS66_15735 [Candidatus Omnitrophica bacterium]|nr:hypothetical protein [Candidatus Omnitrophota bacterium]
MKENSKEYKQKKNRFILVFPAILTIGSIIALSRFYPGIVLTIVFVFYMGFIVAIFSRIFFDRYDYFINFPIERVTSFKHSRWYYISFVLSVICLSILFSVISYNESDSFIIYSYPAIVLLCSCRIMRHRYPTHADKLCNVISGSIGLISIFIFMKVAAILLTVGNIEFFNMGFLDVLVPKWNDIVIVIFFSFPFYGILIFFERLTVIKKEEKSEKKK